MDIIFYVIWCNEERRNKVEQQLKTLKIPYTINYFKASVPENSQDYIIKGNEVPEKLQCCFRSHIRALQDFVVCYPDFKYILILEDDVSLTIHDFVGKLKDVIRCYEDTPDIDYVSLGYLPTTISNAPIHLKLDALTCKGGVFYDFKRADFTVWGSQAQLFSFKKAKTIANVLFRNSGKLVLESVKDHLTKNSRFQNKELHLMIDALLPLLFSQAIVCPPLVIEDNSFSTIHGDNKDRIESWKKSEKAGMFSFKDFFGLG
jgi:GR25 family glycosyltransferase involved in LPS biosynthesis